MIYININFIKKEGESNPKLKNLIIEKIGDGNNNVCIDITDYIKDSIFYNDFNLGDTTFNGVKATKKIYAIYLISDINAKNSKNVFDIAFNILPIFKHIDNNGNYFSSRDNICRYSAYDLEIEDDNGKTELKIFTCIEPI